MIGLDNMSITGGQLISYGIGAALAKTNHGWRAMVALGAVPALILCCLLPFCPESPRQLIYHDKPEEAAKVIKLIFPSGTEEQVQQKVLHITGHVRYARSLHEGKGMKWMLKQLYTVPSNLRALIAACGLMAASQLTGFNTLMYYSSTLFALIGFNDPVAVGTIIAATNFFFTIVNFSLVDKAGRRRILLSTVWGMVSKICSPLVACILQNFQVTDAVLKSLFLALAAVAFHWIPINHDLTLKTNQVNWAAYVVLVCMILFVGFYSSGIGNMAWLSSEFYPMEVRAYGTMMLTCSCWGANIIVASTFLTQMENTTPSGTFGFYAGICFVTWIGVYFCYPEVKGMTLEDIREVFKHGFGVKYANELQKKMRQERKMANSGNRVDV